MPNFIEDIYNIERQPGGRILAFEKQPGGKSFTFGTQKEFEDFALRQEEKQLTEAGFLNPTKTAIDVSSPEAQQFIQQRGLTRIGAVSSSVPLIRPGVPTTETPLAERPSPSQLQQPIPFSTPTPTGISQAAQVSPQTGLIKVPTGSVGPDGRPIFDVFENGRKLELPEFQQRGLNIEHLKVGQAPQGFQSQFQQVQQQPFVTAQEALRRQIPPAPLVPVEEELAFIEEEPELAIIEEARTKFGITDLEEKVTKKPERTFENIYEETFASLGLNNIGIRIDATQKKLVQLDRDFATAVGNIDDNPFLSEAGRVGQVRRVEEIVSRQRQGIVNELTLLTNSLERGRDDAKDFASRVMSEFHLGREIDEDALKIAQDRAEKEIEARIEDEDEILSISEAEKLSLPFGTTKTQAARLGIIPQKKMDRRITEVGGRRVIIDIDSGEIITDLGSAESLLGAISSQIAAENVTSRLIASRGTDGFANPTVFARERAAAKMSASEFDAKFGYLLSPEGKRTAGVKGGLGFSDL